MSRVEPIDGRRADTDALGERRVGRRAEQKRRWDNKNLRGAEACADCGEPVWKRHVRCQPCAAAHSTALRDERWREIQRLWHAGKSLHEIAAAIGKTRGHVGRDVTIMRQAGWDMPYRYKAYERRAAA